MSDQYRISDLTIASAAANKEVLLRALEEDVVEVDFSDVSEIDTSGLQLLIAMKKQADAENKQLRLDNISHPIKELFEQYQMSGFFD
ncbi:MAG: STAS domain-containing protein [Gammaproteobacteria bacterium]|nr:STAS domain-containing protein [Gammaproteobacteria bacterium]